MIMGYLPLTHTAPCSSSLYSLPGEFIITEGFSSQQLPVLHLRYNRQKMGEGGLFANCPDISKVNI